MNFPDFSTFFTASAREHLLDVCMRSLQEDGCDLTSDGIFPPEKCISTHIIAKQAAVIAGLPIIPIVLDMVATKANTLDKSTWQALAKEGEHVPVGTIIAHMNASVRQTLRAERVILNMISHLSGIATLTQSYVQALEGTGVRLLDTRKTLPGLRFPDKYAVLCGGGMNHRLSLMDMLMLKDNHIDAAGSITQAVASLQTCYNPCPPIEVECRTIAHVREAITCPIQRIMLDNMDTDMLATALPLIPSSIEAEISGNVTLDTIRTLATCSIRPPDFISVGRITHSAPSVDFSMRILDN